MLWVRKVQQAAPVTLMIDALMIMVYLTWMSYFHRWTSRPSLSATRGLWIRLFPSPLRCSGHIWGRGAGNGRQLFADTTPQPISSVCLFWCQQSAGRTGESVHLCFLSYCHQHPHRGRADLFFKARLNIVSSLSRHCLLPFWNPQWRHRSPRPSCRTSSRRTVVCFDSADFYGLSCSDTSPLATWNLWLKLGSILLDLLLTHFINSLFPIAHWCCFGIM